jgi:predicted transcriptional regulator
MNPTDKMRVMYRSNLNFQRFNLYFRYLLSKGFLEALDDGNSRMLFRTTDRGRGSVGDSKKSGADDFRSRGLE